MNIIHRSIWNDQTGTAVAVSENAKSAGKKSTSCVSVANDRSIFTLKALATALMFSLGASVYALPAGGSVAAGGASISNGAAGTTITQSTQNVVINWQSFSIAAGQTVQFVQPNSGSVALNRVSGPDPSSILGSLSANGKVFLVNPNGILFGSGASVNVGGLVASTLNITDTNFMAGKYSFTNAGSGTVVNEGTINADGGYVALLGANVSNQGVISARMGSVALAAGNAVTLDVVGDKLLNITVDQGAVNALVQNGGLIQADGGQVLMTTQAAGNLLSTVVNNTGVIRAQTLSNINGSIKLLGDMQSGTANVGGTLDASAPNGGNGGFIETSAAHVNVLPSARITTAAAQGLTGNWLIDPVDYTIAATSGDITGAQLGTNLSSSNITILSSSGSVGTGGNINVSDVVSWSANKLTLNAQNNINIDRAMTGTGTASLSLLYGQATAGGGTSTYNVLAPVTLPAGPNFTTQLGAAGTPVNYTVITALGTPNSSNDGTLQGMTGNMVGNFALGSNIDASQTSQSGVWNLGTGSGFNPVGVAATPFRGNFDGLGHTITNLTIARPLVNEVGLFGNVDQRASATGTMLRNVTFTGGSVSGGGYVGTLVGHIFGNIDNSRSTQAVTGTATGYVGDLVGWSTGNISNSSTSGNVTTAAGANFVGGLVGWITGNIDCCGSTSTVVGGGLETGGLVGWITGNINRSYATGNVSTTGADAGGLAGWITGSITDSFASGNVSTAGANAGGLVGWKTGAITNSYSSGTVTGASRGGLVGANLGGTNTGSFWDITNAPGVLASGSGSVVGITGMSTANMMQQVNFTSATPANGNVSPAWNFTNFWTMTSGTQRPQLQACLAPVVWTAVSALPIPVIPPVLPPTFIPVTTPYDVSIVPPYDAALVGVTHPRAPLFVTSPALPPEMVAMLPPELVVEQPVAPVPVLVVVPPVTPKEAYVAPVRPRKQDRH
jgi:filamentous hemagglutinin family protein